VAVDPQVLDLIEKLRAKEFSLRTIGGEAMLNEAAACAAKIAEVMLKHKIDMTEVERQEVRESSPIEREVYEYDGTEEYRARSRQAWEIALCNAVARAHDCRALVGHGYLVFVGRAQDRAVAVQVFRILRREITEACTMGYRSARRQGLVTRGYIASFFIAATSTIARRYAEMKEVVVSANMATALVRQTDEELADYLGGLGLRRTSTKPRGSYSNVGAAEGVKFGMQVSLGQQAAIEGD
jgi:hypothetical protein